VQNGFKMFRLSFSRGMEIRNVNCNEAKDSKMVANKDCCHKLSCECDAEGKEEAAAAAAVQKDRHDNDSAGGWLEGGLAGS
jgi:hypothetical protein